MLSMLLLVMYISLVCIWIIYDVKNDLECEILLIMIGDDDLHSQRKGDFLGFFWLLVDECKM